MGATKDEVSEKTKGKCRAAVCLREALTAIKTAPSDVGAAMSDVGRL